MYACGQKTLQAESDFKVSVIYGKKNTWELCGGSTKSISGFCASWQLSLACAAACWRSLWARGAAASRIGFLFMGLKRKNKCSADVRLKQSQFYKHTTLMPLPQTNKNSRGGGGGRGLCIKIWYNKTDCRINKGLKDVAQTQQQRPNLPTVVLTWHVSKYKVHKLYQRYILCDARVVFEDVLLVEFMYLVFTCMSGYWCCSWLWSSPLCLWDIFWEPTPLFVDCIYHSWHSSKSTLWPILYKKTKTNWCLWKAGRFCEPRAGKFRTKCLLFKKCDAFVFCVKCSIKPCITKSEWFWAVRLSKLKSTGISSVNVDWLIASVTESLVTC